MLRKASHPSVQHGRKGRDVKLVQHNLKHRAAAETLNETVYKVCAQVIKLMGLCPERRKTQERQRLVGKALWAQTGDSLSSSIASDFISGGAARLGLRLGALTLKCRLGLRLGVPGWRPYL